mgnify:CR=1 FL=1
MLASLAIRDVVLIERLDLSFGPGLTVLTGETGAGKSILLDSLGLACDTPRMDNRRPVGAQMSAVHGGIQAAAKLRAWMFENTTALKRWADLLG